MLLYLGYRVIAPDSKVKDNVSARPFLRKFDSSFSREIITMQVCLRNNRAKRMERLPFVIDIPDFIRCERKGFVNSQQQ